MLKQIFRITFVTLVWKQYKQIIVSTIILFAYLWLVGSVHSDYLSYVKLQENDSLAGLSFVLKWAAFAAGVLLYMGYHVIRSSRRNTKPKPTTNKSAKVKPNQGNQDYDPNPGPDPFAEIRDKDKLRSRAEIMIDREDHT